MRAVAFNFQTKQERAVSRDELLAGPQPGFFYWIVIKPAEREAARDVMMKLCGKAETVDELLGPQKEARYDLYDHAIHFSVCEAWMEHGKLQSGIIEFLLGQHYLAVVQPDESRIMDQIRRIYREDFEAFAKSPGFLLYELASVLLDYSRQTFQNVIAAVECIQLKLFGKVSDEIFLEVARLKADILSFRRLTLASRDLFNELSTRKSLFISETTQPALASISERLERLGDDLDSERSVLTETLNLYMGMVSHRTNRIVNRLTIFSMLFLPLSFAVGVYGMNFEVMPELKWPYSYAVFWSACVIFVISFIITIKRKKWI